MSEVGTAIKFPDKPSRMSSVQYDRIRGTIPGGAAMGFFERFVFFVVLAAGEPGLVAIWLGFKVASKWDAWSNIYTVPDSISQANKLEWFQIRQAFGAKVYQRLVIGTAANLLAAAVGAGIIRGALWLVECASNGNASGCPSWL
jgi:hypothetical protein